MTTIPIDSPLFQRLLDDLQNAPKRVMPYVERAMSAGVMAVKSEMAQYPSETEANHPGRYSIKTHKPMGYYERGRGYWYPVMRKDTVMTAGRLAGAGAGSGRARFGKSAGVVRGRRGLGVAGYKLRPVSENLGKNWVTKVVRGEAQVVGIVGNNTSYANPVQGEGQSRLMRARGWQNITQSVERAMPTIVKAFEQQAERYIKDMGNEQTQ